MFQGQCGWLPHPVGTTSLPHSNLSKRRRIDFIGLVATLSLTIATFSTDRPERGRPGDLMFTVDPVSSNFFTSLCTVDTLGAFPLPKIARSLRTVSA